MTGTGYDERKPAGERNSNLSKVIDFSRSYNPLIISEGEKERISNETGEVRKHENAAYNISNWVGVRPSNIMVLSSLTEIIHLFYRSMGKGRAILLEPVFPEHHRAALISGMKQTSINLGAIIQDITLLKNFHPDVISLNSPVNPTGETLNMNQIESILEEAERIGAFVFIDEAFVEFYEGGIPIDYQKLLSEHNNFLCGRTLSKIHGVSGLRLGYAIAPNSIIKQLDSFSVRNSQELSLNGLDHSKVDLKWVHEEREYIKEGLESMGLEIIGNPTANFISFRTGSNDEGQILQMELERNGIIIRDISNFYGFVSGDFRICIRNHNENELLLKKMHQILKK